MNPISVTHIAKSFGDTKAVSDVSFEVKQGEVFGLLGPNGAGKTTTIRMLLSIFKPDRGTVSILGGEMTNEKKEKIGYMPEDRGLYQDSTLERCLIYLGKLKGIPVTDIRRHLEILLNRFDLVEHKDKKVKELSKGMQQKAQIINTILHQPELIIIDEPFTALDPLNVQLVKDLIVELAQQGTTIIMSTHQMHMVEELCDRILLIDDGQDVLYGDLGEIRQQFSGHEVLVRTKDEIPKLPGVKSISNHNHSLKLTLAEEIKPQEILQELIKRNIILDKFEVAIPSLDEIFIRVVKRRDQNE